VITAAAGAVSARPAQTLAEHYAAAKAAEGEAARPVATAVADATKAAIETAKELEESDDETSVKGVQTEDVNTELCKIDAVYCPPIL